ncbi:hypothetical protein [Cupriavidus basilensis]|uniref:hypothetical protein n=1 Tax=Cupriavidus basilensis TaxID=68895 RepID=UPI0012E02E06|nr:hypothetical protein [Cupriavidus basilensis]
MEDLIARLKELMDRADHRPGQWHCCKEENGRICVLPEHLHSPEPRTFMESVRAIGAVHDGIAREFSGRDMALVVAAINTLPELLALAEDGQKYRALGRT